MVRSHTHFRHLKREYSFCFSVVKEGRMVDKEKSLLPAVKNVKNVYGKVVISLENCLLPEDRLASTPSNLDGLDPETEMDLRILGCELIQTAGILLKLPQVVVSLFFASFINGRFLGNYRNANTVALFIFGF